MKTILGIFALSLLFTQMAIPQDTIQVSAGWNNIGSLGTGVIPDLLISVPPGIITTSFYGYVPGGGYQTSDTLRKGIGYWIKVSAAGVIIFPGPSVPESCGTKTVPYAGGLYHTVLIGNQCWLQENLNVGSMIPGSSEQTDNALLEKYCFENSALNCAIRGGLYEWGEAMQYTTSPGGRGICPPGWHIPTHEDWQILSSAVGGDGNALKEVGEGFLDGAGTNTSGFTALLAGIQQGNSFGANYGYFWSSTAVDTARAYYFLLTPDDGFTYFDDLLIVEYGMSVRCVAN